MSNGASCTIVIRQFYLHLVFGSFFSFRPFSLFYDFNGTKNIAQAVPSAMWRFGPTESWWCAYLTHRSTKIGVTGVSRSGNWNDKKLSRFLNHVVSACQSEYFYLVITCGDERWSWHFSTLINQWWVVPYGKYQILAVNSLLLLATFGWYITFLIKKTTLANVLRRINETFSSPLFKWNKVQGLLIKKCGEWSKIVEVKSQHNFTCKWLFH